MKAIKTGAWAQASQSLGAYARGFDAAASQAILRVGHMARKEIVTGITKQAPGGQAFQPLAKSTQLVRRAQGSRKSKALIVTGELRKAVTVKRVGPLVVFVGILRQAVSSDGQSLVNIAEVHEYGKEFRISPTDLSRRFFFWVLRKTGHHDEGSGLMGGGGGGGAWIVRIPPRPFFGPVAAMMQKTLRKTIEREITKILRQKYGLK